MRILWLSPWLRTLTRVQVDALTAAGHSALVVTTDQHYEKVATRPDERVRVRVGEEVRVLGAARDDEAQHGERLAEGGVLQPAQRFELGRRHEQCVVQRHLSPW